MDAKSLNVEGSKKDCRRLSQSKGASYRFHYVDIVVEGSPFVGKVDMTAPE